MTGSLAFCLVWKFPTFWEGAALLPVTGPAEPVMNLKLHCIQMLEVLQPKPPTRPNQVVLLLLKYRISNVFFITVPMHLQALFSTFIFPWHRPQVHASSLDMHADMNFNQKKIITWIKKYLFYNYEHIRHRNLHSCL